MLPSSSDLFEKDEPGFLEALATVELPDTQSLPAVTKEPSLSSDLFGTDDPSFLDALSKTALVEDASQIAGPNDLTQFNQTRVRKRSRSPSLPQDLDNTDPVDVIASNNISKISATYTDSDIYGASKFGDYGEYMSRKRAKLSIQNNGIEESSGGKKSTLFQGLALYINGKTDPSVQELRKLIIQHGGVFHPYLDRKKMVTHIIASNLTPSKVLEFKNMKVATPAWLLESIKAGTLLPWRDYLIGAGHRLDESQGKVHIIPDPVSKRNVRGETPDTVNQPETTQHTPEPSCARETKPPSGVMSSPKSTSSSRPLYATGLNTTEATAAMPSYAPSGPNPVAKRKMEDPEWRAANTAVAPGFIEGYYKHSRLHHLSAWKSELQDLVSKAIERVENGEEAEELVNWSESDPNTSDMNSAKFQKPKTPKNGKGKGPNTRVVMHCDFDSFFVSAGIVDRPHLKGKPVVVCHSQGTQGGLASTSEIASSSYEARKFGIKNGMSLGQAKKLCPDIHTIPYEFERYKQFSLQFYTILISYADDLQAVSVDEALIDVTSAVENLRSSAAIRPAGQDPQDFSKDLAETIRTKIRNATGCEVSIGISHNILLARIATRRAKPAGAYHILPEEVPDILAPLDIKDLRGFGHSTRSKVEAKFGVTTLGELTKYPKGALCDALGKKTGETLWNSVRGIDDTKIESDRVRKSVSSEINYGIRFNDYEDAEKFLREMAVEVSRRLTKIGMCAKSLTLKVMTRDPKAPVEAPKFLGHGICDTTNRTAPLAGPGGRATADENTIGECAWRLLRGMNFDPRELRGIGIHAQKLERMSDSNGAEGPTISGGQTILPFQLMETPVENNSDTSAREKPTSPIVVVDPSSQDIIVDSTLPRFDDQRLRPGSPAPGLPSFSQVDPSFLEALPAHIRDELELEYARVNFGSVAAGPSRYKSPEVRSAIVHDTPYEKKGHDVKRADIARITQQFAPKSRPSLSPSKRMHPLFAQKKAPIAPKVSLAELKLLDIDPEVWSMIPVELQREQLAASRAANVGTGMAIRASMSTQAKQERILHRWRVLRQRSPSVGVRGRRPEISAKALELPGLKQRGKSKNGELRVSETDDVQAVIEQWVQGFEDDGPRLGDVEYFGKFLERCVETDVGAEKAVSVLKWWRILLRQRWGDMEKVSGEVDITMDSETQKVGQDWWHAFWDVKRRMDDVLKKRFGGKLSLR